MTETEDTTQNGSSVSRRRFVLGAGASGLAAGLSGCASVFDGGSNSGAQTGSSDSGGTTVTWGFDATVAQDHAAQVREALHNKGGLSDDIRVEFQPGQPDSGKRRAAYNRLLSSQETSPDMFMMDNGWVNIFIQRGQLANLSEVLSDETLSTIENEYFSGFTETAIDPASGNLFGVPLYPDYPTMLYRKDLVERAGYNPTEDNWATEPMTWEEWSNIAADVQDDAGLDYGFTTQWDIYVGTACCTFNEVMSSWGGAYFGGRENLFGPVGERPVTVDSEPVIDSLNMMRKFVHDEDSGGQFSSYGGGFTPTNILSWIEDSSLAPFIDGNAVFHRNWPYAINQAAGEFGDDLGTMPIPYAVSESEAQFPGTGGTTSALGGWHITANPYSEKLDAVAEVIQAATREEFQLFLLEMEGWLPPRADLFGSSTAENVEPIGNYMDTLRVAGENTMARPVTAVWNNQSSKIAQQTNRAVDRAATSAEAMRSLQSTLEQTEQPN
ncbi:MULTISPECIES: extracellular solute-binding protein [Haloarcula]|uniref:Sugar ABC transporter substrate-binding protein n=1 Tax=Haloarcula pellucida TaxID=1427151 RepID=A0A830GMB8_9EURY|nr:MULTISPECIES: extracellular solute-binding protein [Halomicroarcula]MBX0349891.1 extracellular solute-binding protein [Halomicroarcula pellucida]MDS0279634.1 extracellular solute-binding protein [Halomicroarcula sp. S1AR25-4]GGN94849.1 sugar ABC transporter substrate-binding protein [Halomicroarcula pellucida]